MKKYKNHFLFWSGYILYAYLMELWRSLNTNFLDIFFANACQIITFYIAVYAYYHFANKKYFLGVSFLILSLMSCWSLRYIYVQFLLPLIGVKPYRKYDFSSFTNNAIRAYVMFGIYALGYFFAQRAIQRQKEVSLFEQKQAQIEKEKLEIENKNLRLQEDFLRAQINPHFLYNCLNFFYSETLEKHPYVADGILMLSDIMRYSLKDYSHNNGLTELSEEIEHIENVVNIHQMRFVGSLHIKIKVEGHPEGKLIAPMVLITLVENVFKHGDLHDSNHPAIIHCKIDEAKKNILLSTYNKKKTGSREPSTGIGLANIEQRLQSLYPDNFSIHTFEDDSTYKKDITIPYFEHLNELSNDTKTYKHTIC